MFDWRAFKQTVGITMGTNCAPFLADLHINSHEAEFIQELLKKNEKKVARPYYLTFRYTDYVLSLGNSEFGNSVDRTYPIKFDLHIQLDQFHTLTFTYKLTASTG